MVALVWHVCLCQCDSVIDSRRFGREQWLSSVDVEKDASRVCGRDGTDDYGTSLSSWGIEMESDRAPFVCDDFEELGGLSVTEFVDLVGADSWYDDGDRTIGDGKMESPPLPHKRKSDEGRNEKPQNTKACCHTTLELYYHTKNKMRK